MDGDQSAKTFDDGANKAMGAAEDFGTGIHESAHQRVWQSYTAKLIILTILC